MSSLFIGPDAQPRCRWCGGAPEFLAYHDHEWGFPVADDRRLFEKISLEAFQSDLSWRHEPPADTVPEPQSVATLPAAVVLSKELKRRGWKFVGPTTVYAFMQAMGLVNDHATGCSVRAKTEAARRALVAPHDSP